MNNNIILILLWSLGILTSILTIYRMWKSYIARHVENEIILKDIQQQVTNHIPIQLKEVNNECKNLSTRLTVVETKLGYRE